VPAKRVFAKLDDGRAWREYKNLDKVPELTLDGGISAELWQGAGGSVVIRTVQPGEDFWIYTNYCFAESGELERIRYEIRTAWGWGYRLEGQVTTGTLHGADQLFFKIETGRPIAKPSQADDLAEALKPTLYLRTRFLPFSRLLNNPPKSIAMVAPQ
jgi:hypothetical protein